MLKWPAFLTLRRCRSLSKQQEDAAALQPGDAQALLGESGLLACPGCQCLGGRMLSGTIEWLTAEEMQASDRLTFLFAQAVAMLQALSPAPRAAEAPQCKARMSRI